MAIFSKKKKYWVGPAGYSDPLYSDMLQQPHLLIAGTTGSGKSVLVNNLVMELLLHTPERATLVLIDPKRVELSMYRSVAHCVYYASEPADMITALEGSLRVIEDRYTEMQKQGLRKYEGHDVYIIIDELADLMTTQGKTVKPLIQRIGQIGRAARVHMICCTQSPISKIIPTEIKVNFDARVGLRTRSAQDSRNILGISGCETLPRYGQAYYMTPDGIQRIYIYQTPEEEIQERVDHWSDRKKCMVVK